MIKSHRFDALSVKVKDLELPSCCDVCHTEKSDTPIDPNWNRRLYATESADGMTSTKQNHKDKAPKFGHSVVADSSSRQSLQTPSGKSYGSLTD